MDFIHRLQEVASQIDVPVIIHAIDQEESIRLSTQAGGRTEKSYMNGCKIKELPYEFVFKTKTAQGDRVMAQLAELIEDADDIPSEDGSYQFMGLEIVNEPFFIGRDNQQFLYYRLVIKARLFIKKRKQESE
ncbi:minor capsid protein [Enterococcus casseliflavus]|uniref:minor capsid protein n=1 Tax=Enterococcus sp. 8E11_MSG4843 TaxID=1834190 RepID=UPI000B3EC9D7|nr:minor capsid protein [Enterococcus sp. 8E11_MSG4843]MBO1097342.1 minor capsid protein [Enterococcus casseliflavus]MBO1144467.1 minor capsid protein [Enterococcus casseliflavus]OUZ36156.1 hypothetical protein A5885_000342 [Enterococcus sp. 8E11_MSG4843]